VTGHRLPALPRGVTPGRVADVANRLHSTTIHVLRDASADDRSLGLTPERLSLLSVVVFAGPLPVGRIADIEGVSVAAVSRSVSALEALGLVTKERDDHDTRVVLVAVTPMGRRLLDRGRRQRLRRLMDRLDHLDEAELDAIERACDLLDGRV